MNIQYIREQETSICTGAFKQVVYLRGIRPYPFWSEQKSAKDLSPESMLPGVQESVTVCDSGHLLFFPHCSFQLFVLSAHVI